jgi:hypothetical protein
METKDDIYKHIEQQKKTNRRLWLFLSFMTLNWFLMSIAILMLAIRIHG